MTVEHHERAAGRSGYTMGKLIRLWVNMFTNFSILPLRLASLLGLLVAGMGVLAALAFTLERVRNPDLPIGWASLAVIVLVLSGVQLFTLGMIGEYLGRHVSQGRRRAAVRGARHAQLRDPKPCSLESTATTEAQRE